ncbi:Type II secretory pathway component [Idiomarina seosinensis]|uniref:Type II secretory pathway component n=1 Tax=Idiomarina seosinensis TaxID=281739 RepID=A0A432ZDG3_9GAMM|nr:Type II secretory pathway component [Idiomarina seosinensis]RUO75951.1 Type II secretory pathway component [Idiomarina seosinensis]
MRFGASQTRSGEYRIILHLGEQQLRLLVLRHTKHDHPEVVVNDTFDLSAGDIPSTIEQCQKRYHKLDLRHCVTELVLGVRHYQAVAIDRPDLPEQDIASSLAFQLGELVELAPEDMITDYYELPYQASGHNKVVAVVAKKSELVDWVHAIINADWQLVLISVGELQLKKLHEPSATAVLCLYPVQNGGYIAQIYHQGQLCFSRGLRGLRSLDGYSKEEIELGAMEPMATELQRSMDYFESQLRQAPVKQIQLAIKHPQMDAMKTALQDLLAVNVEAFSYQSWMNELCEGDFSDIEALAAALPDKSPDSATGAGE